LLLIGLVFAEFVFRKGIFVKEVRSNGGLGGADVGLLQLNSSIVTGAKNTGALSNIFNKKDYILLSFSDLLAEVLDKSTFRRAQKYLVLLNAAENNTRLLQDINPLRNAEVRLAVGGGRFKHKHVQFRFRREISKGKVSRVLVYIKDAKQIETEAKKQTRENISRPAKPGRLKQSSSTSKSNKHRSASKAKKESVAETASQIMEMDESIVGDFLEEAIPALEMLVTILRRNTDSQSKLRGSLDYIGRTAHRIKGDAAILNFDEVVRSLHKFEDRLEPLKNRPILHKSDFDSFIAAINQIIVSLKKFTAITQHVDTANRKIGTASAQQLFQRLQSFVGKVSRDTKKDIRLIDKGFEQAEIPIKLQKDVMSMVVQLLRNAVVHGIEDKAKRKAAGKKPYGSICLGLQIEIGTFTVSVRDDGAGLDYRAIRQVAISSGRYSKEQINNYTSSQLRNLILQPGFSTSKKVDEHSGRGIGLDLVNTTVKTLGGSLFIRMNKGEFTEFAMTFPLAY
jgi:signal transduction histidine kinase